MTINLEPIAWAIFLSVCVHSCVIDANNGRDNRTAVEIKKLELENKAGQ